MPIKHHNQSGRGDSDDSGAIQPSHWNADHDLTGLLALIDALALTPNSFFTLDGSNLPVMKPLSSILTSTSPALAGVPTAPTANPATNSTQIATTAFVQAAVAALINGAPGALDTLKELADAINDDASYAATITTALALKAPLNSPTFTGTPVAPTPSTVDSSTKLATTAFVQAVLAAFQGAQGQCRLTKSGANIVLSPVRGNLLTVNGVNVTVPSGGVTLAPSGLTPGTLYYIYATASGGVVNALVASTTAHATDATTGVEVMSGDSTKTLVGMVRPIAGPAFADSLSQRFVRSWFNRLKPPLVGSFSTTRTTVSTTFAELHSEIRTEFLIWVDESAEFTFNGFTFHSGADYMVTGIAFDGATTPNCNSASFGTNGSAAPSSCNAQLSEGYHYASVNGKVGSGGTGTVQFTTVGAATLQGMIV
jgi:hypothetical protein